MNNKIEIAVFGVGSFWCTEAIFEELDGVMSVVSGYAGGTMESPSYEKVSNGTSGHAEVTKIEFDPDKISYQDLLTVFFYTHDPTTQTRQGADVGEQYRSMILYANENQKKFAEMFIKELTETKAYKYPILTELKPLKNFYEAEDYHQDYYKNNASAPYCQLVIAHKIEKLRKRFKELLHKDKNS